ncbi:MAG: HupE/UreJ family protein [Deltaproteobacteria bacterium]|nr:HupE/UreJ family protein [Deltaproteobacteria bacterium]MBW2626817.1 HupE/UreJ family protein [Deltaproteobacteria bacterium]
MMRVHCAILACIVLASSADVRAHGLAAAFVSIETADDHEADVLIKLPRVEGNTPGLSVRFADGCEELTAPTKITRNDGVIERWAIRCERPLTGMEIGLLGFNTILGEALVEFRSPNTHGWSTVVRRGLPTTRLGALSSPGLDSNAGYLPLGIEHILSGFDHVFFVLALLLIVWRTRSPYGRRAVFKTMLATITAFTVGHSVTLAAATLGLVRLAPAPTELVIALSVLLLAVELARDDRSTLTMRFPWIVALAFGLLHGFGFAGALAEIGLPPEGIAAPLLLFNLGVEVGQIIIVLVAASAIGVASSIAGRRHLVAGRGSFFDRAIIYGIGTLTAYWCFERSLGWILG